MVGVAVADNGTATFSETDLLAGYNKLISIRDEIISKRLPVTEQINHSANLANTRSITQPPSAVGKPAPHIFDGISKPAAASNVPPAHPSVLNVPKNRANASQSKSPSALNLSAQTPGSSGIDPIFLTKSTVLVRAEINQKRQRLEKALEDQIYKSQRQKAIEQDALPDFDVTETLKKAQELVKPTKLPESRRTNGVASSSDSFDERTFYSSQMDDSTTTESTDESHKWRPHRICKFYLQGTHCRYGDSCTFSHDPGLKQKLETEALQGTDVDKLNADEQASSHHDIIPNKRLPKIDTHPKRLETEILDEHPTSKNQAERERQERIARLEAELRSAKAERETLPGSQLRHQEKEKNGHQEESVYSPPGPDEFGRDVGLRETGRPQTFNVPQRRLSADGRPPVREYTRHDRNSPSSMPTNVRIVTNHIRSPVAPQPSRVSPLATAKVPQVSQVQRENGENRRSSRGSNTGNSSARQSPKIAPQPRSSKKRRRGRDSGEQTRNVVPRTDYASPVVRVKEEPMSPPPFDMANTGLRQVRLRQEVPRPLYVDTAATQYREEQPLVYQARPGDSSAHGQINGEREPQTPSVRRIVSRNGQRFIANEEPELRRVVTAPRPTRAPASPAPYPVQYSAPQPRAARAASQVYLSPTGQAVPYQSHALATFQGPLYTGHDRSLSPAVHRVPQSPSTHQSTTMAPPPRRIVIDQWGNRFMEAPLPVERHASVAPVARVNDFEHRYEPVVPRSASVARQPNLIRVGDDGQYVRRAPSPISTYGAPTRGMVEPTGDLYDEASHITRGGGPLVAGYSDIRPVARYEEIPDQDARIVRMRSVRPAENGRDEGFHSDERNIRMQSVRPQGDQYDAPREHFVRVQSVRPEQPRIINLGERQESGRRFSRQVSVHPNNEDFRGVEYAVEERPRYQYASQVQPRSYVEEIGNEHGLYDTPGSGGRRLTQRM